MSTAFVSQIFLFKQNLQNSETKIKMEQFLGDIRALIAHSPSVLPCFLSCIGNYRHISCIPGFFRPQLDSPDLDQPSIASARSLTTGHRSFGYFQGKDLIPREKLL